MRGNQYQISRSIPNPIFPQENRVSSIKDPDLSIRHPPHRPSYPSYHPSIPLYPRAYEALPLYPCAYEALTQNKPNSLYPKTTTTSVTTNNYKQKPPLGDSKKQTQSNPTTEGSPEHSRRIKLADLSRGLPLRGDAPVLQVRRGGAGQLAVVYWPGEGSSAVQLFGSLA